MRREVVCLERVLRLRDVTLDEPEVERVLALFHAVLAVGTDVVRGEFVQQRLRKVVRSQHDEVQRRTLRVSRLEKKLGSATPRLRSATKTLARSNKSLIIQLIYTTFQNQSVF